MSAKCQTCRAEWTSLVAAHCRKCHETFGTTKLFDRHRKNYTCLHPEALDLMLDTHDVWREVTVA